MNEAAPQLEKRLKRGVETATLCAYYGGLLTGRQLSALRLHYGEDLSLGEIADELGVTRQNVHELIARSEEKLWRYERLLGCAARSRALTEALNGVLAALAGQPDAGAIARARDLIAGIIRQQEGEDDEHGV